MTYQLTLITVTLAFLAGCSAIGSVEETSIARNVVRQVDQSNIEHVSIATLHDTSVAGTETSAYAGEVVEVTGKVVAFALSEQHLYTVTLREDDVDAICIFDDSISGQLGGDRPVRWGSILTVQGQYQTSGLFASNPFTLDGCRIVE